MSRVGWEKTIDKNPRKPGNPRKQTTNKAYGVTTDTILWTTVRRTVTGDARNDDGAAAAAAVAVVAIWNAGAALPTTSGSATVGRCRNLSEAAWWLHDTHALESWLLHNTRYKNTMRSERHAIVQTCNFGGGDGVT